MYLFFCNFLLALLSFTNQPADSQNGVSVGDGQYFQLLMFFVDTLAYCPSNLYHLFYFIMLLSILILELINYLTCVDDHRM